MGAKMGANPNLPFPPDVFRGPMARRFSCRMGVNRFTMSPSKTVGVRSLRSREV